MFDSGVKFALFKSIEESPQLTPSISKQVKTSADLMFVSQFQKHFYNEKNKENPDHNSVDTTSRNLHSQQPTLNDTKFVADLYL